MHRTYVVGAARTPVGSFARSFRNVSAVDLGVSAVVEAIRRANTDEETIDEVIMGNVLSSGLGQNPARQIAVGAGIDEDVPSFTVNKVCGSGLKAVALGAQAIMLGHASIVCAGGTESMSRAPYLADDMRWGSKMGHVQMKDSMLLDGLWCSLEDTHMGLTAENIASTYQISRQEQDEFALKSHQRAVRAIDDGSFADEIVAVTVPDRKKTTTVDTDEHPRRDTSLEKLKRLPPVFTRDGTVTAGNASGINDGAAAVILASDRAVQEMGLKPMAEIVGFASAGVPPGLMGTGPIAATRKLLSTSGWDLHDIDVFEINEAFASQAICVLRELELDPARVNINGGGVALGHPIGASGTRILVTLLYQMRRQGANLGLASLCIGGGQGISMLVRQR